MRPWFMSAAILLLSLSFFGLSLGQQEEEYQGKFDPSNVLVVVESYNGWGSGLVAGLGCDGRLKIVGAYRDTTSIRSVIAPDSALAIINELLGIDFFGQPAEFRPICGTLRSTEDGKISVVKTHSIDAGASKITLHLGPKKHSVTLRLPAYGAPEALLEWERRFRSLVQGQVGE